MEFYEKLQALRKQKGLTQEELAEGLYVSRTAVSKWESGRGYPSIDSLKQIAKFFSVTVDELTSGDEVPAIAEGEQKQKAVYLYDLVFGLLDLSCIIFFFLPFFGQKAEGVISAVSLVMLTGITPYIKFSYFAVILSMVIIGILTLALQNHTGNFWEVNKRKISLLFNAVALFLFIISSQPYGASILFVFLVIKGFMLIKKR